MGGLQVAVVEGARQLDGFLELPYRLYRGDPFWVPPLRIAQKELFDRRRHPFYANAECRFFLARRGGEAVGRIAAILDRNHNDFHNEQAGFFGFFESIHDPNVSRALLDSARAWLTERGARVIRGPVNPSTNYECGLLVEGFDSSPVLMMTYNPPWYQDLIEGAGFRKAKDLYAYWIDPRQGPGARAGRIAARCQERYKVNVRSVRLKDIDSEADALWALYNAAWVGNWGFVPVTRDEFRHLAREMKPLVVPELTLIAEIEGKPAGFALGLPDINRVLRHLRGRLLPFGIFRLLYQKRRIRQFRVLAFGVKREFQLLGVAAPLYTALIANAARLGYEGCEFSWQLEDNFLVNRSVEALGGRLYKRYRIYEDNSGCDRSTLEG